MRFHPRPFEYEVVAIVDNEAGINSAQDLRGSKFCHPGHGLQNHWTDILANVRLIQRKTNSPILLIIIFFCSILNQL